MFKKIYQQIYYKIITSYVARKYIYKLLSSPLFVTNPLYPYLFNKNIHKKIKNLEKKPLSVVLENTNLCNVSCIFCFHEQMKREKGFMREDLFRKVIDQCAFYKIPQVLIMGFGEPLLDKDYVHKVSYAKKKGIGMVFCITNAILLNKEVSESLIKSGLDFISISIDAATAEVYGKIHRERGSGIPSDKFFTVVENIDNLISLKQKYNSKKPFIQVRFKDFDKNKPDLSRFMKKYKSIADEVIIYMNIINWPGTNIKNNLPQRQALRFPCYNLWASLFVTHDGRVALCCQDYDCRVQLGDVNNEDIMDIWNGQKMNEIRQLHFGNKFDKISVCSDCVINTHYVSPWWG